VFEALRFNPQAPFLTRVCLAPAVVARGSAHQTTIPAGSVVLAALMSAMFDADELDQPEQFNPARPARHYLHFGHGLHQCFGRHINRLQIPLIVRSILRLPGLRRAAGQDGVMTKEGPFPERLVVEFDPPSP
jgi:cytochrome P450